MVSAWRKLNSFSENFLTILSIWAGLKSVLTIAEGCWATAPTAETQKTNKLNKIIRVFFITISLRVKAIEIDANIIQKDVTSYGKNKKERCPAKQIAQFFFILV